MYISTLTPSYSPRTLTWSGGVTQRGIRTCLEGYHSPRGSERFRINDKLNTVAFRVLIEFPYHVRMVAARRSDRAVPQSKDDLKNLALSALHRLQKIPHVIRGFFSDPHLAYITQ